MVGRRRLGFVRSHAVGGEPSRTTLAYAADQFTKATAEVLYVPRAPSTHSRRYSAVGSPRSSSGGMTVPNKRLRL